MSFGSSTYHQLALGFVCRRDVATVAGCCYAAVDDDVDLEGAGAVLADCYVSDCHVSIVRRQSTTRIVDA